MRSHASRSRFGRPPPGGTSVERITGLVRRAGILGPILVLTVSVLTGSAGAGQGPDRVGGGPRDRLRAADAKAGALVAAGAARSATFRGLVEAIERSDLLVYVQTGPSEHPGQLQLLAATPECRHLRVLVRVPGLDNELVAWLAHELAHAVEVAAAREVRDQAGMRRLYQRIGGTGSYGEDVESGAAQEAWTKVLREMRAR